MGKALIGVAHTAKRYGKPVIALASMVTQDATAYSTRGTDTLFPMLCRISILQEVMGSENVRRNTTDAVKQVLCLFLPK